MVIKVLGNCCSHCANTYTNVVKAVRELNLNIPVEQEGDMMKILQYRVLRTPAIVINENVVSENESLTVDAIKELILNELD
jgi:hypothetical protein